MTDNIQTKATRFEQVFVYVGPSRPSVRTPDFVCTHPPASYRQLNLTTIPPNAIVVFVDGLFFHTAAVTHFELLTLLAANRTILGASSMGAMRAVELRQYGMIGVGTVYQYYLSGCLRDDSELAEAVCPYTFQPLTVPLVRVRRALALAAAVGVCGDVLDVALQAAATIHFLDRSLEYLRRRWSELLTPSETDLLAKILQLPESDVKTEDARQAMELAIEAVTIGHLPTAAPLFKRIHMSRQEVESGQVSSLEA